MTGLDLFNPEFVVWAYEGAAECAVRALLNLVHPQHPHVPTTVFPAPRSLHIPRYAQRPMTIRLPPSAMPEHAPLGWPCCATYRDRQVRELCGIEERVRLPAIAGAGIPVGGVAWRPVGGVLIRRAEPVSSRCCHAS